ncbi:MAG TPA: tetraacyldisaccharide 4'-kinase [Candidatus Coprenecus stercoravium]|uniref:Tetraacyldisaccharide 4'-kinase n=1 Tax=Candidatus Coprenecus stercoravium TaxID=2840735 RepID=A0A9D2GPM3_9BACT|nr:tetraacyldisaccharide 4'-kinase [Candidatus Coprenecus stercoravium]
MILDKVLLFPYYCILALRNMMYDKGILKSYPLPLPSICVGNVTVGGTGKTPMVELLVRMYKDSMRVAVVSRGYGRKTKGFRYVSEEDTYRDVGDEPLQIKKKFPDITVVVDASRRRAVDTLASLPQERRPELVILDDAFQHRRIRPGYSILLVSSTRPVNKDALLPIGRLRDLPSQIKRADMVVVTKVEDAVSGTMRYRWRENLRLPGRIPLMFSRIAYLPPLPVFPEECDQRYVYAKSAVVFSGIADDRAVRRMAGWKYAVNEVLRFGDHHGYTLSDMSKVAASVRRYSTSLVLTTEKDAQRIVSLQGVPSQIKARLFYLPIESEIIPEVSPTDRYIEEELPGVGLRQLKEKIIIR